MPPTNAHDAILAGAPLTESLTTLSFRSKALTIRRAVLRFMTTCLSRKMSNLLFIWAGSSERDTSVRRQIHTALERHAHGGNELIAGITLENVAADTAVEGFPDDSPTVLDSHEHDPRIRLPGENGRRRREAIDAGHGDVGDDRIGPMVVGRLDESRSIRYDFDDVVIRHQKLL